MIPRITPDADAEELRAVVRDFLERHTEPSRDPSRGWDPAVWRRFATEIGAVGLDVPEEHGGMGATFREVGVVAEELGRSLARLPWFSTAVLGVGVLLHGSGAEETRRELMSKLVAGDATATLAYRENSQTWAVFEPSAGWRLDGGKVLVVEGASADLLFVTADTAGGPTLFAVDGMAAGVDRTPLPAMDPNRQLADITFDGVAAVPVGTPGEAAAVIGLVLQRASAALGCEQTGGAAAAMELAVHHARNRVQFGRPIAAFQAIKHRCADMAVRVEAARSASLWAAAAISDDPPSAAAATATAALVCGAAYRWVAAENVQVHGGIGFTWEHSAHLHVRRALTSAVLVDESHHDALLDAIGA
ncbi:acyl-CoA dehydrogenase family protein [Amycolatopsis sp. YIM 10]|uniref:acyl-CoA dehydrogenase family protein n=1 Tax=Amycolatopsis sp. YIM 10 TaxID=2653857 RepID=UPI00129056C1|nr:acyl-CoA dehydrogenase family protein [Amycolatopsis sp. YIM 10]QFU91080.1 Acyl-CoA dehydrogenase [Amycolatopsis sp. YIM 10]